VADFGLGANLVINYKQQDFSRKILAAHGYVRENRNIGKVILKIDGF